MHLENVANPKDFLQAPVPAFQQTKPITISNGFQINTEMF